jgi:23S rRNA (cytosine1962-C5)-methyltransferase
METNTVQLATVILRPGEADRVIAGHPWVYAGSVLKLTRPVEDGMVVQVKDHRQRFLGVGLYNSKSKINVRMIAPERVALDEAFFETRIRAALAVRTRHMPKATTFRVVNAESDFLSGLIVDKYEDVLVLQTSALGMDRLKPVILAALRKIFSPKAIVERNDAASRRFEGLPEINGLMEGALPKPADDESVISASEVWVRMNGLRFVADLLAGHKTGLYLDQQVNQQRVSEFCPGARVLDCFAFQGGFALHAARAGAASVVALDQSQEALAAAARNAQTNGLEKLCEFVNTNAFDWLKNETAARPHEKPVPRFDVIILDPPSFTRNRQAVGDAMRGYKEIHLRALKLLKPGGTLATFCCSHHVDAVKFLETIIDASVDAHRRIRRVAAYSQSPDHPIIPAIAETEYLKGFAFEAVD